MGFGAGLKRLGAETEGSEAGPRQCGMVVEGTPDGCKVGRDLAGNSVRITSHRRGPDPVWVHWGFSRALTGVKRPLPYL